MLISNTPPWHLWGGAQDVEVSIGFGATDVPINQTVQLAKASYGRPDTWHWVFFAQLISGPAAGALENGLIEIDLDLTIGLGRTQVQIPVFEHFEWRWNNAALPTQTLYSTESLGPNRIFGGPVARDNVISEIVAQEIQLQARARNGSDYTSRVNIRVGGFFAPVSHVRPDWFLLDKELNEQFPGGEIGAK